MTSFGRTGRWVSGRPGFTALYLATKNGRGQEIRVDKPK